MVRSVDQSLSFPALKILRARHANARESVVSAFVKSKEQDEDLGVFSKRVTIAPAPGSVCQLKRSNILCVMQVLSECEETVEEASAEH